MISAKIDIQNNDLNGAMMDLAHSILALEEIGAILVPQRLPTNTMVMPVLVSDPHRLADMDPLAPAFPLNAAKIVSRLTRKPTGEKVAVMLRPCEIRAFVELVKLNQGQMADVLIIGQDCLGAYTNKDYITFVQRWGRKSTSKFLQVALDGQEEVIDGIDLSPACRTCEHFLAEGADIAVALFGTDTAGPLLIQSQSSQGDEILKRLGFPKAQMPAQRDDAIQELMSERITARDQMMAHTAAATNSLEKLATYLSNCVNCYNCRVACPVCYCRQCVFVTDVFDHESVQYLGWAKRKGAIKMPTDTIFFHLTRLVHMSTACVGCGQCSNACPNAVPVMALFKTVALATQRAFDYRAGKDVSDRPPLSEFREEEFEEVVG
jgi:formate dehydrogenase subunit beta